MGAFRSAVKRVAPDFVLRAYRRRRGWLGRFADVFEPRPIDPVKALARHRPRGDRQLREAYVANGGATAPFTYVLVRIMGNDLTPRHRSGQSLGSVRFILDNEPEFPGVQKVFLLNRIVDAEVRAELIDLLDERGAEWFEIAFDAEEYAQREFELDAYAAPGWLGSRRMTRRTEQQRSNASVAPYRRKALYAMNVQEARNAAIEYGAKRGDWVLPWDGNCYLSQAAWDQLRSDVEASPHLPYFVVPMARTSNNELLKTQTEAPHAPEEPQVVFRCDATERFDERLPYGRRNKIELLWRLGVPGPWDRWPDEEWDVPRRGLGPDAGQFGVAGWVNRLFSGAAALEKQERGVILHRGRARNEAIKATLDLLDGYPRDGSRHDADELAVIDAVVLGAELADGAEGDAATAIAAAISAADEALGRRPSSVTDKPRPAPGGDLHDYFTVPPYWWYVPGERDPDKRWVRRDGQRSPATVLYAAEADQFDRTRVQRVFDDTMALALARRTTGESRYGDHASEILERFFLDAETAMRPHLRFAQLRPERAIDEGNGRGTIEFKDLYFYLDAVRMLAADGAVSDTQLSRLREWLREYLDWLLSSPQGAFEFAAGNNHGSWFDSQVMAVADFVGDVGTAREAAVRALGRVGQHFDVDGNQPYEFDRTLTRHYTHFNLASWLVVNRQARRFGVNVWGYVAGNGATLPAAVERLADLESRPWTMPQIEPFDEARRTQFLHAAAAAGADVEAPGELYSAPPVLHPHDGVRPFWNLGLARD